ncbi:class I SAM-dependent methyltransferase [Streptomyces sp. HPF1205]|uniref:class I SAM-dependent methyltransferase n=1 Tax=Streptomyces sp. HPF1205 TaxID=2873262 RepID=UPI001CEC750B|nr:class I SAM-dependent methyltransferase [Streptomyces sp. HPF1205]
MPYPDSARTAVVDGTTVAFDEVERAIRALPRVAAVRVSSQAGPDGAPRLVAHVTPAAGGERAAEVESRRVDEWQSIYEWVYGELPQSGGFGDNFVGWHSSYTNLPIPLTEMREWRDATVARILAHRPRRVLEIGVGTGLLMAAVAPTCERYLATDFSPTAIARLTEQIAALPELAGRVRLQVREADDFSGLDGEPFDLVVLNSVAQYFPNADYLADVIRGALRLVRPGGAVFAGDIRNLRLLPSFRTAVLGRSLLDHEGPWAAAEAVRQSCADERELLIDPDFFAAVRERTPEAGVLTVRVKRAVHHNELSRHRYDAVLYRSCEESAEAGEAARLGTSGESGEVVGAAVTLEWGRDVGGADEIGKRLAEQAPWALRVESVPNARVRHETAAARLVAGGAPAAEAVAALDAAGADGTDPEEFARVAAAHGYRAAVAWGRSGEPDHIDVVFTRAAGDESDKGRADHEDHEGGAVPAAVAYTPAGPLDLPFAAYGNDPARAAANGFVAALRSELTPSLPGALMPSAFVLEERP